MSRRCVCYPQGVCTRELEIVLSDDKRVVESVHFTGGCNGNTQAVAALVRGRTVEEVVGLLRGIDCKGRGTSCPDQLARALTSLVSNE